MPQASFNYINSIVGSGVIGIPYALHRAGFGLGLFLLVVVAIITDYSLILMVSLNNYTNLYKNIQNCREKNCIHLCLSPDSRINAASGPAVLDEVLGNEN